MYTNEDLKGKTQEELTAIVLQYQQEQAAAAVPATDGQADAGSTDTPATTDAGNEDTTVAIPTADQLKAMTKEDLVKLQSDIGLLSNKVLGDIEGAISEKEKEVFQGAQYMTSYLEIAEQTFIQQYGSKIVRGVEITVLLLIAGRLFGVI